MANDTYASFAELAREKEADVDYVITEHDRGTRVLVMAPHGGLIEPYTSEIAESIADADFSFYSFAGIQRQRNHEELHISSHRFDEPRAIARAAAADLVFAVHGYRATRTEFVMPGGRHDATRDRMSAELRERGFRIEPAQAHLRGEHRSNICNRGALGAGVQLEISRALRTRLKRDRALRTSFVEGVRAALLEFEAKNGTWQDGSWVGLPPDF